MSDALQLLEEPQGESTSYRVLLLDNEPGQTPLVTTLSQYGVQLTVLNEFAGLRQLSKDTSPYDLVVVGWHINRRRCEKFLRDHPGRVKSIAALTDNTDLLMQQIRAKRTEIRGQEKIEPPVYGKSGDRMIVQLDIRKECLIVVEQFNRTFFSVKHIELFGGRLQPGIADVPVKDANIKPSYLSVTVDFKDVFLLAIE